MFHNICSYSLASNTVHSQLRNTNPVVGFCMVWFAITRLTLPYVHWWAVILKVQWVVLWNVSGLKGRGAVLNPMVPYILIGISRIIFLCFAVITDISHIRFCPTYILELVNIKTCLCHAFDMNGYRMIDWALEDSENWCMMAIGLRSIGRFELHLDNLGICMVNSGLSVFFCHYHQQQYYHHQNNFRFNNFIIISIIVAITILLFGLLVLSLLVVTLVLF